MKKLLRLTKLLLTAALFGVGQSAWGQASYNQTYTVSDGIAVTEAADNGYGYFLYNVGANKFFTGGRGWGAYATADHAGKIVELISVGDNYKIHNKHVSANSVSTFEGYLVSSLWADNNDQPESNQTWSFVKVGDENKYTIYSTAESKYLYYGSNTELSLGETANSDNYYWIIVPKTVRADKGDYTYYLQNQGFNRPWEKQVWNGIADDSNSGNLNPAFPIYTLNGAENACAEKYHTVFNLYQTISESVPNGKYTVSAQAFYRQDDNGTGAAPTLYANSDNQNLCVLNANGENTTQNMDGASASFDAGLYVNQVSTVVTDGKLKVGIDITQNDQWVIWDNFAIDYLGTCLVNDAEEFTSGSEMVADKWYYVDMAERTYTFSGDEISNVVYTADGNQLTSTATGTSLTASQNMTAGRYYIKSTINQTLVYDVERDEDGFAIVARYDFTQEGATDPFTNRTWSNRQKSKIDIEAPFTSKAVIFYGDDLSGKTAGYHTLDFSELTGSSSQVKVEFDFYVNSSNCDRFALRDASIGAEPTKDVWTGTGAIFSIGAARVSKTNYFGYNGIAIDGASFATPYHVTITVDLVNKKVAYKLTKISDGTTVATGSNIEFKDANASACTRLDFHGSTNNTMAAINNIVIKEFTSSNATTYSVEKYDKNGVLIGSSTNLPGLAGETSSASDADKLTFYSADSNIKYAFDENDERNVTSLELTSNEVSNVLKLYFNSYTKQTCTVTATDGTNDLKTVASGTFYSDESSLTLYWSKFIEVDGNWYETEPDATTYYGHTFTTGGNFDVTYTLNSDVIYFAEYNNICARTYNNWSGDKASGGNATILANASNTTNTAASTGIISGGQIVDIYLSGYSCRGDETYTKVIYLNDGTSDTEIGRMTFTEDVMNTQVIKNVVVSADSRIKIYIASGNDHFAGDYLYIKKVTTANVKVGENGYATFASPYALDLTDENRPAGLKAYKATLSGTTLSFEKLNQTVPAGTGLLLLGEDTENPYEIKVVSSGDAVESNALTGVTTATSLKSTEDGNYYFVMKKAGAASDPLTFAPLSTSAVTIPAGKAYVEVPASAFATHARSLAISFIDDVTGINTVDAAENHAEGIYNLNGQRVVAPSKGLYIMNGKKVIMK